MIELRNISLGYAEQRLLDNVNLRLCRSTLTALVGRNGAGKSTLIRAITANLQPLSGEILICGRPLNDIAPADLAKYIAYVSTERPRIANLTCREVVAMGRMPYTNWFGTLRKDDIAIIGQALDALHIDHLADRDIASLSDGEMQRTMIAKALAQQSPIIILDEPSAFLDIPNRHQICRLLASLATNEGKCILFSTHDIDAAQLYATQFAAINNRNISTFVVENAAEQLAKLFDIVQK